MTLWCDLIAIPEHVDASSFVLKLSDGLERAQHTVDSYVVTRGVRDAFEQALGLIGSALTQKSSKAAYLHGSFGSGKSHFMAVLDLLLTQEYSPLVRQIDRLVPVISKHDHWLDDAKLLMIPYHFLGATSMESKILGGYVEYVRKHHPNKPLPGVYVSTRVIDNADELRATMGDEAFFAKLNEGASNDDPGDWMSSDDGWNAASYERARGADPDSADHTALVGAIVATVLPSVREVAAATDGFVDLDRGLQIISRHAHALGYQGVILFLDELILWLSRRAADLDFIAREEQKLSKLVESQHADRPAPIISFIARQRPLQEFVGDRFTGSQEARLTHSINYAEGRFDTINLEDRDLPLIASERLLKPKDAASRERIEHSFERHVASIAPHLKDLMRTKDADDETFRRVYPFSPALVQALVALSNTLQRERTALRLMLLLLVEHRDHLALDHVVPVGDLWDVVSRGQQPFNDALRRPFMLAVDLWTNKIVPLLDKEHGFDSGDPPADLDPLSLEAWNDDARLFKTLMIAALVPQVEALRDMTVSKLTALNLSAVRAVVPGMGMEVDTVFQKLQRWAGEVSELRVVDERGDARVRLELLTEDPEILLDAVASQDSDGARRRKVRDLLFEMMDLGDPNVQSRAAYKSAWRGERRDVNVYYRNVREHTLQGFFPEPGTWSIFVDYPFDGDTFTPNDDVNQLARFRETYPEGADTIAWLPHFFSESGQRRLGRLILVEHVLADFEAQTRHLAAEARPTMRQSLQSMRSSLYAQIQAAMLNAFGLTSERSELVNPVDEGFHHLHSLRLGHDVSMPGGASFPDALEKIVHHALNAQYPDAPKIPHKALTPHQARTILEVVANSIGSADHRTFVENKDVRRLMKDYAEPLRIGKMGEDHFSHVNHWRDTIDRQLSGDDELRVGDLRAIIDPPERPTGVPRLLTDVIICMYALTEQMALYKLGIEHELTPGRLDDSIVLVPRELPDEEIWSQALSVAREVFGIEREFGIRDPRNVGIMAEELETRVKEIRQHADDLPRLLARHGASLGLSKKEIEASKRYAEAIDFRACVRAMTGGPTELINKFVEATQGDSRRAVIGKHLAFVSSHTELLRGLKWQLFETLASNAFEGEQAAAAETMIAKAREVFASAEVVRKLALLADLEDRALKLITDRPKPPPAAPKRSRSGQTESKTVRSKAELTELFGRLEALLGAHGEFEITIRAKSEE